MKKTESARHTGKKAVRIWNTPKGFVMLMLCLLLGLEIAYTREYQGLLHAGVAIFAAALVDVWVGLLQKRKRLFPDGAIVTGLIIALVLSVKEPWYIALATSLFAIVSKHILRVKRKPVFNPAAFGLLLSVFVFSSGEDWWGSLTDLPVWAVGIMLAIGFAVAGKANKFPQAFSFLGAYFTILLALGIFHIGEVAELYQPPFINAVLFLSFLMVTDPPTSPGKYAGQIWFGVFAAIVSIAWNLTYGGISFLLVGLIASNLVHAATHAVKTKSLNKEQIRSVQ